MRVLVVSGELDSVTGPSTLAAGRGLKDLGHDVVVASLSPAAIDSDSMIADVPIIAPEVPDSGGAWLRLIAARTAPDVIHAQGAVAAVAAYAAAGTRCPIVVSAPLVDSGTRAPDGVLRACAAATALVAPTVDAATRLQHALGAEAERIHVIPPTADHDPWDVTARGRARAGRIVGVLSDLAMEAAIDDFLHAAAAIIARRADVSFVVLGDRPERQRLERVAAVLGIREKVGFLRERGAASGVLGRLDVLCLPGPSDATPFAAVQSMAAGTPIVAANVPELTEIVGSGRDAMLAPPSDPAALADAVCQVLDRALVARRVTRAARRRWRHLYSVARVAGRHERLYLDCLEPGAAIELRGEARPVPASA